MENTLGLRRIKLQELVPDITNALIVGVIIAEQTPRILKNGPSADGIIVERAVWNFTLRDSTMFYINVTCWETKDGILRLHKHFGVGDVVDIHRPHIEIRRFSDHGEQYRPNVTSPYFLTLNDELNIMKHEGNKNLYYNLMHLPTKPIAGAYTIADIHNQKNKLEGVDVFGILRQVGMVRVATMPDNTVKEVREIIILDKTHPGLKITIWDPHLITRVGTWKLLSTVIFITNLRCKWSTYSRSMIGNLTPSTIITEDPAVPETEVLRNYAKDAAIVTLDVPTIALPNPSSIQNVMSIKQILNKIEAISTTNSSLEEYQFNALVYAVITQLDLDGISRCVVTRCSNCGALNNACSKTCINTDCQVGLCKESVKFDIRMTLSDHTGSLLQCRLTDQIAEAVLYCEVQQFMALNDEQKSILKWKLLMERCAIRLHIVCTSYRNPQITVVSCDLAEPIEVSNKLPHY